MKEGDKVRIATNNESFEGILMPSDDKFAVIKLSSGYNVGVNRDRIKELSFIEKLESEEESVSKKSSKNPRLPIISILHTGGTIASKVDYKTGGVISRFSPEELLSKFPEIKDLANIRSRLSSNMFSGDMRFAHQNILVKEIKKEISKGVDGIIITHGTDTMHYSSAGLSFMLKNLPIPVVLVGSQRSSDRGSTDAHVNIISAVAFITQSNASGVFICMHENSDDSSAVILPGVKSRKVHTSARNAFKAVNSSPIASVDPYSKSVSFYRTDCNKKHNSQGEFSFLDEKLKVGMLYTHPNLMSKIVKSFKGFDGVVLIGTGLGNMSVDVIDNKTRENQKIFEAVQELIGSGTIVVMSSQCIFGAINMNVYQYGRKLKSIGVLGDNTDMHPETAFMKLAWLLSNFDKKNIPELYGKNIVGEISERLEFDPDS